MKLSNDLPIVVYMSGNGIKKKEYSKFRDIDSLSLFYMQSINF